MGRSHLDLLILHFCYDWRGPRWAPQDGLVLSPVQSAQHYKDELDIIRLANWSITVGPYWRYNIQSNFHQIFIVVLQWRLCSFLSTIVIACYYSVATGDVSRSFPLQFGSISPGFMNGMQVYICCMFCRWYNFFTNYNLTKAVPFLLNETITYAAN